MKRCSGFRSSARNSTPQSSRETPWVGGNGSQEQFAPHCSEYFLILILLPPATPISQIIRLTI